jgi:phage I-like protein
MDPKEHERLIEAAEKRGRADAELAAKSALETKDQKLAALEAELVALRAEATAARGAVCEAKITALVGKKLMPAEVGHYVKFAQKAGLEDVLASLEARPDLSVLAPVDGRQAPIGAVREASAEEGSRSGQSLAALFTPRGSN